MAKLRVATAQFPVAASIARNLRYMADLVCQAKEQKADVAHFPETCLGGYAGCEFKSWDGYDWDELQAADDELRRLAGKLRIALVYGTNHRISPAMCATRCFTLRQRVSARGATTSAFAPRGISSTIGRASASSPLNSKALLAAC